jgi:predicted  nucleic acid-binding Zn-ribbon protein
MITCTICQQNFKNQFSFDKHKLTIKHMTNSEIKNLKDDRELLEIENQRLIDDLENADNLVKDKNDEIDFLNNQVKSAKDEIELLKADLEEIRDMRKIDLENIQSLKEKNNNFEKLNKNLSSNYNDFLHGTFGGIGLSIFAYLLKDCRYLIGFCQ